MSHHKSSKRANGEFLSNFLHFLLQAPLLFLHLANKEVYYHFSSWGKMLVIEVGAVPAPLDKLLSIKKSLISFQM